MIEDFIFIVLEKAIIYVVIPLVILFIIVGMPYFIWASVQSYRSCGKWEYKIVHQDAWVQYIPMTVGKVTTMTPIYHPAGNYQKSVCVSPKK
jgi:hypothetical protein